MEIPKSMTERNDEVYDNGDDDYDGAWQVQVQWTVGSQVSKVRNAKLNEKYQQLPNKMCWLIFSTTTNVNLDRTWQEQIDNSF